MKALQITIVTECDAYLQSLKYDWNYLLLERKTIFFITLLCINQLLSLWNEGPAMMMKFD